MRIDNEIIEALDLQEIQMYDADSFLYDIPIYKFKDKERYISKWSFGRKCPIEDENILEIMGYERVTIEDIPRKFGYTFRITKELINDPVYGKKYIKRTADSIVKNEIEKFKRAEA